jgi:hypothetical protein
VGGVSDQECGSLRAVDSFGNLKRDAWPSGCASLFVRQSDSVGGEADRLSCDGVDDEAVGAVSCVVLAGDRDVLARVGEELGVLRCGGCCAVDGQIDGSVILQDDKRRAVFGAAFRAPCADGFAQALGVGTCRVDDPAGDFDVCPGFFCHCD